MTCKEKKALVYTQCMHASQKVDIRDILHCDYKVIVEIENMLLDPISYKKRKFNKWALVSHLPFDIFSLNL